MAHMIDDYTAKSFKAKHDFLVSSLSSGYTPDQKPFAVLLGGQSGAGKTKLHKIIKRNNDDNIIVINGDEFRKLHPNFKAIQDRYGIDSPAYTAKWAGQMTEALIDAFSSQGYNLIVEGTLRTSEVPLRTAALLRERGYSVSLAIMAVKPQISLISCQIRYEMMRLAGTTPHATDPNHHNNIVQDIVDNLAVLESSDLFDGVLIYDRAGNCLFPTSDDASATEVLRNVLFGPWTIEEELHYQHLQDHLEELKKR